MTQVSKPEALIRVGPVLASAYDALKMELRLPDHVVVTLGPIDSMSHLQLMDYPEELAAFTLRKMQVLHLLAQPGVLTTNATVVALCMDIVRALTQLVGHCGAGTARDLETAIAQLLDCGSALGRLLPPGKIAELR
jgi:hypothetical protein